jgi:hypothetical protein
MGELDTECRPDHFIVYIYNNVYITELYRSLRSSHICKIYCTPPWQWNAWGGCKSKGIFINLWYVWETGEVQTGFWWWNLRERDHLEDPGVDERIILKRIFTKWDWEAWTWLIWLRIGTGGGLLWMRKWTFGFHKTQENFLTSWGTVSFSGITMRDGFSYCYTLLSVFWWCVCYAVNQLSRSR